MSEPTEPSITLEQFPWQCEIDFSPDRWVVEASAAFIAALGLPGKVEPSWVSMPYTPKGPKRVRVGMAVNGVKKARAKDKQKAIFASAAAFDPETRQPIAWTSDLSPDPNFRHKSWFNLLINNVGHVEIDAALEKKIRTLAGANARPAAPSHGGAPLTHDKDVFAAAMTADGAHIASVGHDARLRVWDAKTGAATAVVSAAGAGLAFLHAASIAPDGKTVVTGPRKLTIYSMPDGKKLRELAGHPKGEVQDMCFSPSGKLIASTSYANVKGADNSVALWNAATGKELARWKLDQRLGERVAFAPDERRLFAWAIHNRMQDPDTLYAFDVERRTMLAQEPLRAEVAGNVAAALLATRAGVLAAGWGAVFVLDEDLKQKKTIELRGLASPQARAAFAPDGSRIIVAGREATELIDLGTGKRVWKRDSPHAGEVHHLAWSPSGAVILASVGTRVERWNASDGKPPSAPSVP